MPTEKEATLLLPILCERLGHNQRSVRDALVRSCQRFLALYHAPSSSTSAASSASTAPASTTQQHADVPKSVLFALVRALGSKNKKSVGETCLLLGPMLSRSERLCYQLAKSQRDVCLVTTLLAQQGASAGIPGAGVPGLDLLLKALVNGLDYENFYQNVRRHVAPGPGLELIDRMLLMKRQPREGVSYSSSSGGRSSGSADAPPPKRASEEDLLPPRGGSNSHQTGGRGGRSPRGAQHSPGGPAPARRSGIIHPSPRRSFRSSGGVPAPSVSLPRGVHTVVPSGMMVGAGAATAQQQKSTTPSPTFVDLAQRIEEGQRDVVTDIEVGINFGDASAADVLLVLKGLVFCRDLTMVVCVLKTVLQEAASNVWSKVPEHVIQKIRDQLLQAGREQPSVDVGSVRNMLVAAVGELRPSSAARSRQGSGATAPPPRGGGEKENTKTDHDHVGEQRNAPAEGDGRGRGTGVGEQQHQSSSRPSRLPEEQKTTTRPPGGIVNGDLASLTRHLDELTQLSAVPEFGAHCQKLEEVWLAHPEKWRSTAARALVFDKLIDLVEQHFPPYQLPSGAAMPLASFLHAVAKESSSFALSEDFSQLPEKTLGRTLHVLLYTLNCSTAWKDQNVGTILHDQQTIIILNDFGPVVWKKYGFFCHMDFDGPPLMAAMVLLLWAQSKIFYS